MPLKHTNNNCSFLWTYLISASQNTPKTIPNYYEGTWWVPLKTPKTIRISCEGPSRGPVKHTKNNFQFIMIVLLKCVLNIPNTVPNYYEWTWWVPLKTPKTIRITVTVLDKCLLKTPKTIPIYYEGTWSVRFKHTKSNSNLVLRYLTSAT